MTSNREIRLGVLGLHNHYHIYPMARFAAAGLDGLQIVGVYDERAALAEEFAKLYNIPAVHGTSDELLERSDVDGVLIMSFTTRHHADVLAAVRHGKHILLDKPISTDTTEATEMVRAAEDAKVILMMAYLIRYLPAYRKAKEFIDAGVIGRPLTMKISIRCPLGFICDHPGASQAGWYTDPKRGGAGGFLDHGIHYADTMRFLLGSEPISVIGKVAKLTDHNIEVDDYGVCVVTTNAGQIITIESTWHAAKWYAPLISQDECLIVGTEGEIHIHYQKSPQLEVSGNGIAGRAYYDWLDEERYEVCYRDVLLEFADAIRGRRKPSVTGGDGRIALAVIEAAYRSSKTGTEIKL
jgi:predicted dehydrogenase